MGMFYGSLQHSYSGKRRKTNAWKKKGVKARREGALERLKASKFTPKIVQGKDRNEKNWTKKKEEQIETLESRIRGS